MAVRAVFWRRRVWWLAVVALVVLAAVSFEIVSGVLLYWLRTGLPVVTVGPVTLAAHVYVGLAALPVTAVKLWLTWRRLFHRLPESLVARLDRLASQAIIVLVVGVNLSGLQLHYQVPTAPKWLMAQLHLWLTVALLVPVLWHLQRYLSPTLAWIGARGLARQVDGPDKLRRRLIWGGVSVIASVALLRLPASVAATLPRVGRAAGAPSGAPSAGGTASAPVDCSPDERAEANDFPVTGYRIGGGAIDAAAWRLKVVGDVAESLSLSYDDILALPQSRYKYQLECPLSFEVLREWGGVSLTEVLALAKVSPDYRFAIFKGDDGYDVTHLRARLERPSVMICTHVNCELLGEEHGYPMRLMMPGVDGGRCVKWLREIEVRIKA